MAVLLRSMPLHTITTNKNAITAPKFIFVNSSPLNSLCLTSRCHLQNPKFPSSLSLPRRRVAAKAGRSFPDSEPELEPPRGTGSGFEAYLSRFQDRVQIFFAVFVWMSLFFWTCAWDDRNRPNRR